MKSGTGRATHELRAVGLRCSSGVNNGRDNPDQEIKHTHRHTHAFAVIVCFITLPIDYWND